MSGEVTHVNRPGKPGELGCLHPLMGRSAAPKAEPVVAWVLGHSGGGEWPRPSLQPSCSLGPQEGGFRGVAQAGGRVLHGFVSSPGSGSPVSSRPAPWLATGHPRLHAEEDG